MSSIHHELYLLGQRVNAEAQEAYQSGWGDGLEYAEHILERLLISDELGFADQDGVQMALDAIQERPVLK